MENQLEHAGGGGGGGSVMFVLVPKMESKIALCKVLTRRRKLTSYNHENTGSGLCILSVAQEG